MNSQSHVSVRGNNRGEIYSRGRKRLRGKNHSLSLIQVYTIIHCIRIKFALNFTHIHHLAVLDLISEELKSTRNSSSSMPSNMDRTSEGRYLQLSERRISSQLTKEGEPDVALPPTMKRHPLSLIVARAATILCSCMPRILSKLKSPPALFKRS